MRKLILNVAVSLDGFIEGPNGEFDWCFTDQDYGMQDFFSRIDSIFIGRKSYELMISMGENGDTGFPQLKEYVFSNTLQKVRDGAELISNNLYEEVNRIKELPGKDIWLFGGASLTASLLENHLVDELSLAVHPILLGAGKPLFPGVSHRIFWKLQSLKDYSSGLVILKYTYEPDSSK